MGIGSKGKKDDVDAFVKYRDLLAKVATKVQKEFSENLTAEEQLESLSKYFGGRDKIPKDVRDEFENQKKLEEEGENELLARIFMDKLLVTENIEDPYGDGDQSMLYGNEARKLQIQWGGGFDYNPNNNPRLSDWCKSLFFARIDDVNKYIAKAKEGSTSDLTQLLNRRESMIRFGGVLHIIAGARQSPSPRHLELMQILLNAGANPSIKDCAGYSALHHCVTIYGNSTTLKLAKLLLEHGTDVNTQNRFGCTPLMEPCINAKFEFVKFLVSNGANPYIKENNGLSCETISIRNPRLQSLFSKGMRAQAKKDKAKKRGSSTAATVACIFCGDLENLKRCTACFAVSYCSRECQKSHWKTHKSECKKKDSKIILVKPVKEHPQQPKLEKGDQYFVWNEKHKKVIEVDKEFSTIKKPFKIKVQVALDAGGTDKNSAMMVYNKDRSYHNFIVPSDSGFKEVYDAVCAKGYSGIKAYFCATLEEPGELSINVSTVFPETW